MYAKAEAALAEAVEKFGADKAVGFPDTGYPCAIIWQYLEIKVATLADLQEAMKVLREKWLTKDLRVNSVFSSGLATAMAAEIIEVVKYIDNPKPYGDDYHGAMSDAEVRELGLPLVTEDIPGFVVMIGPAPSDEEARDMIKGYQSRGIFVFLIGGIIDQARRMGINMNFKVRIVDVGPDIWCVSHVVNLVMRAAMIFGNVQPGDYWAMNTYTLERIRAFVNAYTPVDDYTLACGAGAICLGFPVITNEPEDTWRIPKSLIIYPNTKDWIETSLEARDIKIKVTNMDIPITFNSAFEGEIIRRADMHFDAYGARKDCFELVTGKDVREIEDHRITVHGPDFDEMEPGSMVNLAYVAHVGGKNMQSDFESVFERKFHSWINCLEGVMHTGQRDQIRVRVSKSALDAGFRARHIGEVLYAKLMSEYDAVIDKVEIDVYTDPEECHRLRNELAIPIYNARDDRLANLTDEAANCFYTCTMCQSFSPSHVCIVTPERLGLCGAVSWLDAKATNQLNPNGPCQIVSKDDCQDEVVGIWPDVDRAVKEFSQGHLEKVTLYSLFQDPMTSCGCFECICGVETTYGNGVVIVDREYAGSTPLGMTFAELAASTGGGQQTPGFMGHGVHFIASKKFMRAEGGLARIVWMPSRLKEKIAANLNKSAKELYGIDNFTDMVCDETIASSADDVEAMMSFLEEKGHPALNLPSLFEYM
jgi:acetyl-CoA synthase